jgi:phenylacetate-CoA ligase
MEEPPPIYRPLLTGHASVVWPALPAPPAARLAAMLRQLDDSQWWTPEQHLGQQLRQATALLHHAYRQLPFYRDRLAEAGFVPGKPVTPAVWARIPVLTRAELQAAGPALHSPELPQGHGSTYEISSSGSTGQVVTARGSEVVQLFWHAITLREHLWHQRDFGGRLAAIRPFPAGVADFPRGGTSAGWGRSTRGLYRTGPGFLLSVVTSPEQQAEWLQRVQPDYLLTYPSALRDLLLHCRAAGIALPRLREVRTLSELLPPETRALCREVWGLAIADIYSTQEAGYLALQCPQAEHYHIQSEVNLVEVLDESGAPCRPGEVGRVVVTPLVNFAMPMIRYVVGDLAEVGAPCPCGRGLPVLTRILGRVRNTLIYPDGRRSWPLLGDIFHAGVEGIRQYQIVQLTRQEVELKLASATPLGPAEEDKLRAWLQHRSGHPFTVRFSYHAEIPRGPGGKFETFRSLVAEGGPDTSPTPSRH